MKNSELFSYVEAKVAAVEERLLTVEELDKLPDPPGGRYELHHGTPYIVTFPKHGHKNIQRRLRQLLEPLAEDTGVVETEVSYRPLAEHELWSADVAFVSRDRWAAIDTQGWLQGSPELVVEVRSPSNTKAELDDKCMTALAGGCQEFWVVDPKTRTVRITSGKGVRIYDEASKIPVSQSQLMVAEIFV